MTADEITQLRRIYAEICRGYSRIEWMNEEVFVKHLTVFDHTEIDMLQFSALEDAKKRGILTEEQRLKWLNKKGLWTDKDEKELAHQRVYVENLEKTRSKLSIQIQINQIDKQLQEGREILHKLANKKERYIDLTAEKIANQKTQFEYIRLSFFKDKEMTKSIFDKKIMNEMSEEESYLLLALYIQLLENFSASNLRKIALQSFFTNYFYLCGDDIKSFFGKPIVELTNYQVNLLTYAQYFKSLLSQYDVPKDIILDPDKIEEFAIKSKNAKDMLSKAGGQSGGRVGIVGAGTSDFKSMGVEDGTATMRQAANKNYSDARTAAKDFGYTYTN